jgi:hypothetical protein
LNSDQTQDDTARRLEDWLADEASPMPEAVMASIVEGVAEQSQLGRRRTLALWRPGWRTVITAMVAGLLVIAVAIGPGVVRDLATFLGTRSDLVEQGADFMQWDVMRTFRESPIQLNPAPDAYGHTTVFTYLRGSRAGRGPTEYVVLPEFEADGSVQSWYDPAIEGLYVGYAPGTASLELHPAGGGVDSHAAVIAWRAPVDTSVAVTGRIEVDASCGDGIVFSVGRGTEILERLDMPAGSQTFSIPLGVVRAGDVLYFVVEPGADSRCDTTWLTATIDAQ